LKKPVSKKSLDDAFASMKGFVERGIRELLVVEDNPIERGSIVAAIGNGDVHITAVGTGAEALEALRARPFDCMVLDLNLPDGNGADLLEAIKRELNIQHLRVIVYTGRDLTPEEKARLDEMAETTILKDARSLEHLVDKTSLFLHRLGASIMGSASSPTPPADPSLAGKKVLIVDDDARNVFALTSMLERWEIVPLRAENGRQALEVLRKTPGIDLVLMDIMMPEMDGYETIRAIRADGRFGDLPIIALTAKAMKDDRRKCIEAGASDYLAKPVGSDQLLSTLRVWLNRHADRAHP
jgi:CheY-like chemotaxis protein